MADSTTINFTSKNSLDSEGVANRGQNKFMELVIDSQAANDGGAELGAASFALFDIPEGHKHVSTVVEVILAEGGTCTADIGITGGDVDCLIDGVDLNAAVGTLWESGSASTAEVHSSAGATGGYVTPDGGVTFSLLVNNAMNLGKFRVTSVWLDMRGQNTTPTENSLA
jgi:hypothetical protein